MGGKPSKGTPADRRLAVNKPAMTARPAPRKATSKPAPRKGGK